MIFAITGPSGVGKSYLIDKLIEECGQPIGVAVRQTTRPPRSGDEYTSDRKYLTESDFSKLVEEEKIGIWGEYHKNKYGWLKADFDDARVLITCTWPQITEEFMAMPNVVPVLLECTDHNMLLNRMIERGDSEDTAKERLALSKQDRHEIEHLVPEIVEKGAVFDIKDDQTIASQVTPWFIDRINSVQL